MPPAGSSCLVLLAFGALTALACGCASPAKAGGSAASESSAAAASAALPNVTPAAPANPPAEARAPAAVRDERPRVWAKTRFVWIHPEPNGVGWIGYLWFGGSAPLRKAEPANGPGCVKWVPIEPRGWVCADGERATLDANDAVFAKIRAYAPDLSSPWPHRYAESRGVYRYAALPEPSEQRLREWDLVDHTKRIQEANSGAPRHPALVGVDLTPATTPGIDFGALPSTIHEPRKRLPPLSTIAYSTEVERGGRSYLLGADLVWLPKDRAVPYKKVSFQGVKLGSDAKLPLAFFRAEDKPKFRLEGERLVEIAERFARLSHVELTGAEREQGGETFLETRLEKIWVKKRDAIVPTPLEKTPWGAPVGGPDTPDGPAGRRTWLEASVWKGWLIAYEGTKPVFTTLISPGRGGTPRRGIDPIDTASTPVGTFPITGKFATATMVAPGDFIHSDVPWTQNFSGPHALHGAYWHDDWGERKSGGCVNVSPIDGKWLYEFTEPPMPEGWHGVRWRPHQEPATLFIVHD